jgi:hypothetical protein
MRRLLITIVAIATVILANNAVAGSFTLKDDDSNAQGASPQADESQPYQSCSQVNAPLFSAFPPTNDYDLNSYMHYSIEKSGNLNNIMMWGAIDSCDEARLRRVLDVAKPIGTISLWSGGGVLEEAMAMGRTLRAFGATTLIQDGYECVSACNFIFMGGVIRMIEPSGVFKVHMFDDGAADRLRIETTNPPTDLASFLAMFPFRSDVTIDSVNSDVQSINDANAKALKVLLQIDADDLAFLMTHKTNQASSNQVASNSGSTGTDDAAAANIATVNSFCTTTLTYYLLQDATVTDEENYVSSCIKDLSQPYTVQDWFADQARTEDVKAIQQDAAQRAANIARYLSEMSISLKFLTDFANIPNAQPKALSVDELRDLFIVNTD